MAFSDRIARGPQPPAGTSRQIPFADALTALSEPPWFELGRKSALTYLRRKTWLYRRVESIQLVGRGLVERHVSVDFEFPAGLPSLGKRGARNARLIPVSVFGKWPPLMDFSLTGPDGRPASLYTRDTNKALDFGLLIGMAQYVGADLRPNLKAQLAALVATDQPEADAIENAVGQLSQALAHPKHERWAEAAETIDLAAQLANLSTLWVPVTATRGSDCIVKFSYVARHDETRRFWKQILISCSWRERTLLIHLPHSGLHTRYHLEVLGPSAGLEFTAARTFAFPGASALLARRAGSEASKRTLGPADETQGTRTANTADTPGHGHAMGAGSGVRTAGESITDARIVERRVHIYHAFRTAPSHRMYLQLRVAPSRETFISGCLVAAILIAVLISLTLAGINEAALHLEATVVLLAAVPVVLGYVLVRPAEHLLARSHVLGVRAMTLVAGALPMLGALALLLTRVASDKGVQADAPDVSFARPIWAGLVIFSWIIVGCLGLSWTFAHSSRINPRVDVRDRRWSSVAPASGLLFAGAAIAGFIAERQPYAHVARRALPQYLADNRAWVLFGAACVGVGCLALYVFIGGAWRSIEDVWRQAPTANAREQRLARWLVVGSGVAWIWGTVVSLTLTAWQTLAVTKDSNSAAVASFARAIDAVANAMLLPAGVFVLGTTFWLLRPPDVLRNQFARVVVATAGGCAALLILLRGASARHLAFGNLDPRFAWIALAAWVAVAALALRDPADRLGPI